MPGFEWIDYKEENAVKKIFKDGAVLMAHGFEKTRKNFHVREFENKAKSYFNSKNCLAVSSGTAAIKIALKSIGVKPGDEIITQSFNFIATIEAILDCGAKPIIANVDKSLNINVKEIEKLITKKTKAIIPVHMLGTSCNMSFVKKLGSKYNLKIIEDNCESVGAKYKNQFLGTIGNLGIFSFDHGKIITTGEGGMILTNNKLLAKFCREYHDHGHQNNKKFPRGKDTRKIYGFNYRMTEIQGAIGKIQLSKLKKIIQFNKKRYLALEKIISPFFEMRKIEDHTSIIYDTLIFFQKDNFKKKKIISILQKMGFGTKNLPDAMEWHCSYFWKHSLEKKQVQNSIKTYNILKNCIAVPILKKKTVFDYQLLGKAILNFF
jgi:8-amino-3,8-dideoxy-alpha-D-manno-octulosonate transaminase